MGIGMATNLQKHLAAASSGNLTYHNRTISRGDSLRELGASPAASIPDLAASSDIIFLSLSDDRALEQVTEALCGSKPGTQVSGKIIVDTSTVHPDTTAAVNQRFSGVGANFVAAPVSGASPVAARGELLFLVAGPNDAVKAIEPYLVGIMARDVIRLGEDVTKSSLMKTAGYANHDPL